MLHGALGDGFDAELLSYEAPTYFGMLTAAYTPEGLTSREREVRRAWRAESGPTRRPRRRPAASRSGRREAPQQRLAHAHQHPELIGLGLGAVGIFLAAVLWFGFSGGPVGDLGHRARSAPPRTWRRSSSSRSAG